MPSAKFLGKKMNKWSCKSISVKVSSASHLTGTETPFSRAGGSHEITSACLHKATVRQSFCNSVWTVVHAELITLRQANACVVPGRNVNSNGTTSSIHRPKSFILLPPFQIIHRFGFFIHNANYISRYKYIY